MNSGLLERFKINGLYGYKDIEIKFPGSVLILIAGNGSGKTTVLNAIHAFLRRRFNRLQSLDFKSIECKFTQGEAVVLHKDHIPHGDGSLSERLGSLTARTGFGEDDLYEFLASEYDPERGVSAYRDHSLVNAVYANSPFDYEDLGDRFNELHEQIAEQSSVDLKAVAEKISIALGSVEIVYLPTYRRIENPLLSPRGRHRRIPIRRQVATKQKSRLEPALVNYGLEDVELRLEELSGEVERISNLEYRSASATIIDEALANPSAPANVRPDELPDLGALRRFLSRVSRGDRHVVGDHGADAAARSRIEAITNLYQSEQIYSSEQGVLRYFLSRLSSVIEKTKETEAMLQRFVEACNGYLVESSEEKSFVYEPNGMRVTVVNNYSGDVVPLSQLSSGEKQIVSMLAKLYLYSERNLILIDEPELSLSIEWQRKILPDMVASGKIAQLLAITHSPFIFDNDLDPCAGSMRIVRNPVERK